MCDHCVLTYTVRLSTMGWNLKNMTSRVIAIENIQSRILTLAAITSPRPLSHFSGIVAFVVIDEPRVVLIFHI